MSERRWILTSKLRAVNLNGGANYRLEQCWWDADSGAEAWREVPVFAEQGGVVWADMSAKTGCDA